MKLILSLFVLMAFSVHADEKTTSSMYPTSPGFQKPKNALVTPPSEVTAAHTGGDYYAKGMKEEDRRIGAKESKAFNTGDYNNQREPIDPNHNTRVYTSRERCEEISGKIVCDKTEELRRAQPIDSSGRAKADAESEKDYE